MDLKKVVAHRLKVLRAENHMTQEDLAEVANVSLSAIGTYERAEAIPLLETTCKLAEALNCSPNDICGWEVA